MSDILVQKYQHYFNESVKLQETVNTQAAYIQELEEALLSLSEDLTTDERENENERNIDKAENAAYKFIRVGKGKGQMYDPKTGKPKSPEHLAMGKALEKAEDAARDEAHAERSHPTKIFGKGGKVVGTTGAMRNFEKLAYVDNHPNLQKRNG